MAMKTMIPGGATRARRRTNELGSGAPNEPAVGIVGERRWRGGSFTSHLSLFILFRI